MTATLEAPARAEPPDTESIVEPPAAPPTPAPASLRPWRNPAPQLGWLVTILVTALAALTRFWALGWPRGKQFDEVYYATEAQELLRYGYEDNRGYMFIVHPPLGKWLIAVSSYFLGNDEVGWRTAPAVAGVLIVFLVTRTALRMFRSNLFAGIAGVLMATDGLTLVLSRTALLDVFLEFFVVAAFAALVVDRDQVRARLAALLEAGAELGDGVPTLGPRPWRVAAGVLLGGAAAVKWSGLSFVLVLAVLSLMWDRTALKAAGVRITSWWTLRRSVPGWVLALGAVPVGSYLFAWLGWFAGEDSWNRHWADTHGGNALSSLLNYHHEAYDFHAGLFSPHPYQSQPWSWLVLGRPVLFTYNLTPDGQDGHAVCGAARCVNTVLLIGTPIMWWAFLPMLIWLAWHWFAERDWRAGAVWAAFLAGWVVWLQNSGRTKFLFYMAPLVPFLVLGLTLALGTMLGRSPVYARDLRSYVAAERHRFWGLLGVATFLGLVAVDFIWMWPVFTGGTLTYAEWHAHMWFPSWV